MFIKIICSAAGLSRGNQNKNHFKASTVHQLLFVREMRSYVSLGVLQTKNMLMIFMMMTEMMMIMMIMTMMIQW